MQDTSTPSAPPRRAAGRDRAARVGRGSGGGPAQMVHALEALRVSATLVVLLFHAAVAYLVTPFRVTLWLVYDASSHLAFDYFAYWSNGFAMPLFFLIAGISAPAACDSRGPRSFLAHRARRLLRPLLFSCLTILPLSYLLAGYTLLVTGTCSLGNILSLRFSPQLQSQLYGLGHLWFLEYLYLVCALWCAGWWLRRALAGDRVPSRDDWSQRVLRSAWKPLLLAVPTGLIFCVDTDTMLRIQNSFVPDPIRLLHYSVFFVVGGWIARVEDPKRQFSAHGPLYLVLSLALYVMAAPLLMQHSARPLVGSARLLLCALAAIFAWLSLFGFLGVFLRLVERRGAVMRYLSESSFWLYLCHLPLVALMQALLYPFPWPSGIKFVIVATFAISLSLLSYEYLVRYSLIGEVINGSRKRTATPGRLGPEFGWIATLGLLLIFMAGTAWSFREVIWGDNFHEVARNRLFRSARLSSHDLDDLIVRRGVRTVISFSGAGERHAWFAAQRQICQARGVELHALHLNPDQPPRRDLLLRLVSLLDRCPRPILVQGYRGIERNGFVAAVDQLLDGRSPNEALRQFAPEFGEFGGPEKTALGMVILSYQHWLTSHGQSHSPDRFRAWAQDRDPERLDTSPLNDTRSPLRIVTGNSPGSTLVR